MGKETVLFKNEEEMSRQDAAALLWRMADKLDKSKLTLSQGGKEIVLKIPNRVEIEVKAEKETAKKKTTKKLEVEIEWLVGESSQTAAMKIK